MEFNNVIFEKEENIAVVTINRPKALNALNRETLKDLNSVLDVLEEDDTIYAVVVIGAGEKAFVAGADITEMKELTVEEARRFSNLGNRVFRRLENLEKPVIAAIGGFALGGGCELSLACDIRIASEKASFGQPEVALGVTPGFGGTQRLARVVGLGMAKELLYTGRTVKAEEALRIGLVNRVVAPEALLDEAKALANTIVKQAPIAVRLCKAAINRGMQMDIDTAISYESEIFGECFASLDQKEGMTAFAEKRPTKGFTGK